MQWLSCKNIYVFCRFLAAFWPVWSIVTPFVLVSCHRSKRFRVYASVCISRTVHTLLSAIIKCTALTAQMTVGFAVAVCALYGSHDEYQLAAIIWSQSRYCLSKNAQVFQGGPSNDAHIAAFKYQLVYRAQQLSVSLSQMWHPQKVCF